MSGRVNEYLLIIFDHFFEFPKQGECPGILQKIATRFHKMISGHIIMPYLTLQRIFNNCSNNYLTVVLCVK